jgi:hypothetical protein
MAPKSKNLPLSKTAPLLVIEQVNNTPNSFYWHPGILYKNCLKYNGKCEYLEVSYTFDDDDKKAITENIARFDTIVITNFYIRSKLANNAFIDELLASPDCAGKTVVVITNTPYPLSVPANADNLIVTYATSPHNIEVCAGVLFGEAQAEGVYPLAWQGKR